MRRHMKAKFLAIYIIFTFFIFKLWHKKIFCARYSIKHWDHLIDEKGLCKRQDIDWCHLPASPRKRSKTPFNRVLMHHKPTTCQAVGIWGFICWSIYYVPSDRSGNPDHTGQYKTDNMVIWHSLL